MAESGVEAAPPRQITSDVIVASATPLGESAVGMVRLSGPGCLKIAAGFLRWSSELPARTATLAKAYADGRLLDSVVLTYFPAPNSYTGEDLLEISAHGSPYVIAKLLERSFAFGARAAEPGEFTQRAYLNGRLDLAQAEAVCGLIQARTRLAHRAAVDQLEGGLSARVEALRSELLDVLAHVEAALDHPDEELSVAAADELLMRIDGLRGELKTLAGTHRFGRLLSDGARIAIVGRPNVGKSSLLNSLLGRERAIVSDVPGTTRDTLEEWADLDGLKALFIDTAGLREKSLDPIEQAGMERTRRALASCDLALVVLDRSNPLEEGDRRILEQLPNDRPAIVVFNKSDLPDRIGNALSGWSREQVSVSALNASGVSQLVDTIRRSLAGNVPMEESGVIVTSLRHQKALSDAEAALSLAGEAISQGEVAALYLRETLAALGVIVGETTSEDVLRTVFSKFCVGK